MPGGNAYVAGWSSESGLGDGDASPRHPYCGAGAANVVVLKLDSSGVYQRPALYGANGTNDYGVSIAPDDNHGVFITGGAQNTWQGNNGSKPLLYFLSDTSSLIIAILHAHDSRPEDVR